MSQQQMPPITLTRLRELSRTVPRPKYSQGMIVELRADDRDDFPNSTLGLILATFAYNDDEKPYTAYTVQIFDDPPSEDNDHFDGFAYDETWTVSVFEHQIIASVS